jgi:type II secretion system protein H
LRLGKKLVHAHPLTLTGRPRRVKHGFTLLELMIVLLIVAIMTTIALPPMTEFVADQRVRTTASDMVSEIAFARAKAVETGRRVIMQRLVNTGWHQGWRTYADVNSNGTYEAGTDLELKQFNGFGTGAASASGRLYICSNSADFAINIIFRADGRVVRSATATTANDGIYVIDPMGDTEVCNNKVRAVLFDLNGRVNSRLMKSADSSCPGIAPPC